MSPTVRTLRSLSVAAILLFPLRIADGLSIRADGDCSGTSTGLIPLIDLPPGTYLEAEGGLYPGDADALPEAHERAADRIARVNLRDGTGAPDAAIGRIVLLSVGMSNTSLEFERFTELAVVDPGRNDRVVLVNGAQGGWDSALLADPVANPPFWTEVDRRLAVTGVTPPQVQAVWLKIAEAGPTLPFPDDPLKVHDELEIIVQDIRARFPNVRQLFLSSRIYAGYHPGTLSPEPFAYQSGFAVKWLVEEQMTGAPWLNFDPLQGPVLAPWLAWGPYLWADGLTPRSDGLLWTCEDFQDDGAHPSASGQDKVAGVLLTFFMEDPVASRWFADCAPADDGTFASPPDVQGLQLLPSGGQVALSWEPLDVVAGDGIRYDVLLGDLADLRITGDTSLGQIALSDLPIANASLTIAAPPVGQVTYALVRGTNVCGQPPFLEGG